MNGPRKTMIQLTKIVDIGKVLFVGVNLHDAVRSHLLGNFKNFDRLITRVSFEGQSKI